MVHKYSNQNLFVIICSLPAPTKYFYNLNNTLNCNFICKINIRDNFIWKNPWQPQIPIFRHHYFAHYEKDEQISNWRIVIFSEILTRTTVNLIEKGLLLLFPGKVVHGWNLLYLKFNGLYKRSQSRCTHNFHILV